MHLTFSPALGHTTVVKVPPGSSSSKPGATILFKATFPSHEAYRRARADGVKVELWTDLPGIGRVEGEWGAVQFAYFPNDSDSPHWPTTFVMPWKACEWPQWPLHSM